ncbi:hypothetical protein [Xanthomonas albilineans]|uniref:hypothetical protein n=2 Tax=Xanthomonas albilineans TaxID=29447 RepID=UPI0012D43DD7|nr:hypothetical protein [Xanthomonas albilineans]
MLIRTRWARRRGVQHRLASLALFVLMRPGILAVALFVFALLRIHGLAVQLHVLLREAVLLLARCLRLLFLLLQLRDPRLFLHVHAGRFFMGRVAVSRWLLCLPVCLRQLHCLLLRLPYVFLALLEGVVFLLARVPVHGRRRHGRGSG